MARLKQSQNIDRLVHSINLVIKSRCSLSEEDEKFFHEALGLLQILKKKKGKTNKEVLELVVKIVELLSKIFR